MSGPRAQYGVDGDTDELLVSQLLVAEHRRAAVQGQAAASAAQRVITFLDCAIEDAGDLESLRARIRGRLRVIRERGSASWEPAE